jgi:Na+-driven multidrug efflux pump
MSASGMVSGALRASGRSSVPMVTSIMAFVVIRQIFLAIVLNYLP